MGHWFIISNLSVMVLDPFYAVYIQKKVLSKRYGNSSSNWSAVRHIGVPLFTHQ